jgi:hypothetical protein
MLRRARNPGKLLSRHLLPDTASDVARRHGRTVAPISADELIPPPCELVLRNGVPDTIAGWKALADSLLTDQSCAFHRNLEISSRYAWIYKFLPAYFKWAGMAAFASSRGSRRSTGDAGCSRTRRRPGRLDGQPTISSGRATSSSSSTSSEPWCNPTSIASRVRSRGSSRSARP